MKVGDVTPTRFNLLKTIILDMPDYTFHVLDQERVIKHISLPNCKLLNINDLVSGQYTDVDWQSIPPIDIEHLKNMADCEVEFYSMIERYKSPNNYFIENDKDYLTKRKFQINRFYKGELSLIEKQNLYHKHLRFWTWYLLNHEIKLIIYLDQAPHQGIDFIIYKIAESLKIKVLHYASAIVPKYKFFISNYKSNFEKQKKEIEIIDAQRPFTNKHFENEYKRLTERISKRQKMPQYMYTNNINGTSKVTLLKSLKNISKYLKYFSFDGFDYVFRLRNNKQFNRDLEKFYISHQKPVNFREKYIYVPLHYQPEMTSSPLGYRFSNQLLQIEYLAYYLPDNVKIYVKEHPKQEKAYKGYCFYKELTKINNVILVPQSTNNYELIENCIAVSTLTGTAGWEGLFKNKPFIMFGNHIYKIVPGVFHVTSLQECKDAIEKILNKDYRVDYQFLKKILLWSQDNSIYFDDTNNYDEFKHALESAINFELKTNESNAIIKCNNSSL